MRVEMNQTKDEQGKPVLDTSIKDSGQGINPASLVLINKAFSATSKSEMMIHFP
jgi:hypothetical protein